LQRCCPRLKLKPTTLVKNGTAQSMAKTAWTFASIQTKAPKLLTAIEARYDWLVEHESTQNVTNTVWAFATLKFEAPNVIGSD
jgi:hypothetical protein